MTQCEKGPPDEKHFRPVDGLAFGSGGTGACNQRTVGDDGRALLARL
jgi:hypothetical protein